MSMELGVEVSLSISQLRFMPGKIILDVLAGPMQGKSFEFDRHDTFLFGRHSKCHARITNDPLVSRHHFLLEVNPPEARLRDLGSLNGTFVNKQRFGGKSEAGSSGDTNAAEAELRDADRIEVGQTAFGVRIVKPDTCSQCGAPLSGRHVDDADGARLCDSCRSQQTVALAAAPACIRCGRTGEPAAGVVEKSGYICASCQPPDGDASRLRELVAACERGSSEPSLLTEYQFHMLLGQGSFGMVYLATRLADRRPVAIKIMQSHRAVGEKARRDFLREVAVNAKLRHPNIVALGRHGAAGSLFYFVMEYCGRGNLETWLAQQGGKIPWQRALPLMRDCLEGLAYAHASGIVHRDIKPQNVLLADVCGRLTAKLADFGMAKSFSSAGFSGMTATGQFGGTLAYMPREQITDFKYARPSGDVWSLGATFYKMLTGRTPLDFSGNRDALAVILNDEPKPIRQLETGMPEALAKFVDRSLAADFRCRYSDAGELLEDLKRLANNH